MEENLLEIRRDIFSKKEKNNKVNSALSSAEHEQIIYKKLILEPARGEHFFSHSLLVLCLSVTLDSLTLDLNLA